MGVLNVLVTGNHGDMWCPKEGADVRRRHLLEELLRNGNRVVALESTRYRKSANTSPFSSDTLEAHFFREYYFFGLPIFSPFLDINPSFVLNLWRLLRKREIDIIQISFPPGALAVKVVCWLLHKRIVVVYDCHNVEADYYKKLGGNSISIVDSFIRLYMPVIEGIAARASDIIVAIAKTDIKPLSQRYNISEEKIHSVPYAITPREITAEGRVVLRDKYGIGSETLAVLFHGSPTCLPNRMAVEVIAKYIAPMVLKINNRVLFVIAGQGLVPCQERNVKILGFVPDVSELLLLADMAILPDDNVQTTGLRTKLVEYLTYGLPTVTTVSAAQGLGIENNAQAAVLDRVDEQFVEAICALANDPGQRQRLSQNGRSFMDTHYTSEAVGDSLCSLYKQIVAIKMNALRSFAG